MDVLTIPPPEQLREQIKALETELRALKRLMRLSLPAAIAHDARQRRGGSVIEPRTQRASGTTAEVS